MAFDGGSRGHDRRQQMRAPEPPLTALEVAVRGRGAALLRLQLVGVHAEAHGAAGLAPFKARILEDLVEPFRLRLRFDEA